LGVCVVAIGNVVAVGVCIYFSATTQTGITFMVTFTVLWQTSQVNNSSSSISLMADAYRTTTRDVSGRSTMLMLLSEADNLHDDDDERRAWM
jgi:hypothetical protein